MSEVAKWYFDTSISQEINKKLYFENGPPKQMGPAF